MAKKKLKIAFLSFYSGTVSRGVETFVHELATRLSKKHEVAVFQEGPAKKEVSYGQHRVKMAMDWSKKDMSGTWPRRFFVDYWSRKIAFFTLKLIPIILSKRFHLVVVMNGGWQPAIMRIVTWFLGSKMVIVGQSGIGWDDRNNLWCFPNVFVAISRKAKNWANTVNPFVKSVYLPNGVNLNKFTKMGEKYKTKFDHPIVLCVSALTENKRVDLVIKAVSKLKTVSLLVVGDGPLKSKLVNLATKLIKGRFELVRLPFEEMPKVYRTADIFCFVPWDREAFGIVYLEAMASGLPVVATDDAIRREIVGEVGILVENPESTTKLTKAIKSALQKEWDDKPRAQAEKFSWDKIARKYEQLFLDL